MAIILKNILNIIVIFLISLNYITIDGYTIEKSGCKHNGTIFGDGSIVPSQEPCLNCKCVHKTLICSLKVCPEQPTPPPRGCILVHKKKSCCSYLSCSKYHSKYVGQERRLVNYNSNNNYWNDDNSNGEEYNADDSQQRILHENTLFRRIDNDDDYAVDADGDGMSNSCIYFGTVYKSGSAMSSSTLCTYCYCFNGKQKCIKPKCLLPNDGCQPIFSDATCCPIRYECNNGNNGKIVNGKKTISKHIIKSKNNYLIHRPIENKHYLRTTSKKAHKNRGCIIESQFYPEGQKLPINKNRPCEVCFCIRGNRKCTPKKCTPSIKNCKPLIPDGQCCPSSFDCNNAIEPSPRLLNENFTSRQFDLFSYLFGSEKTNNNNNNNTKIIDDEDYPDEEYKDPSIVKQTTVIGPNGTMDNTGTISTTSEPSFFDVIREGLNLLKDDDDADQDQDDINNEHINSTTLKYSTNINNNNTSEDNEPLQKTIDDDNDDDGVVADDNYDDGFSLLDLILGKNDDYKDLTTTTSTITTTVINNNNNNNNNNSNNNSVINTKNQQLTTESSIKSSSTTFDLANNDLANINSNSKEQIEMSSSTNVDTTTILNNNNNFNYNNEYETTSNLDYSDEYSTTTDDLSSSTIDQTSYETLTDTESTDEINNFYETTIANDLPTPSIITDTNNYRPSATNSSEYNIKIIKPAISTDDHYQNYNNLNLNNKINENPLDIDDEDKNNDGDDDEDDKDIDNDENVDEDYDDDDDDDDEEVPNTVTTATNNDEDDDVNDEDTNDTDDAGDTDNTDDDEDGGFLSSIFDGITKIFYDTPNVTKVNNITTESLKKVEQFPEEKFSNKNTTLNNSMKIDTIPMKAGTTTITTITTTTTTVKPISIALEKNESVTDHFKLISTRKPINPINISFITPITKTTASPTSRTTATTTSSKTTTTPTATPTTAAPTTSTAPTTKSNTKTIGPQQTSIKKTTEYPIDKIAITELKNDNDHKILTELPLINSNPSILEADFNYDYSEPTLPPSLPNLKIIPFLPSDAVKNDAKKFDYYKLKPIVTTGNVAIKPNGGGGTININRSNENNNSKNNNNNNINNNKNNNNGKIEYDIYDHTLTSSYPSASSLLLTENYDRHDSTLYPSITVDSKYNMHLSEKHNNNNKNLNKYPVYDDYDASSYNIENENHHNSQHSNNNQYNSNNDNNNRDEIKYVQTKYNAEKNNYDISATYDKYPIVYSEKNVYSKIDFNTDNPVFDRNNQFSPPSKTEGGFLPKEPTKTNYYNNYNNHQQQFQTTNFLLIDLTTESALLKNNLSNLIINDASITGGLLSTFDPFKDVIRTETPPDLNSLIEDKEKLLSLQQNQFNKTGSISESINYDLHHHNDDDIDKDIISITTDKNYNHQYEDTQKINNNKPSSSMLTILNNYPSSSISLDSKNNPYDISTELNQYGFPISPDPPSYNNNNDDDEDVDDKDDFLGNILGYLLNGVDKEKSTTKPIVSNNYNNNNNNNNNNDNNNNNYYNIEGDQYVKIPAFKNISILPSIKKPIDSNKQNATVNNTTTTIIYPQRINDKITEMPITISSQFPFKLSESSSLSPLSSISTSSASTIFDPHKNQTNKIENLNILRDVLLATLHNPNSIKNDKIETVSSVPLNKLPFFKPNFPIINKPQNINSLIKTNQYEPIRSDLDLILPTELNTFYTNNNYQILPSAEDESDLSNTESYVINPVDIDQLNKHHQHVPQIYSKPILNNDSVNVNGNNNNNNNNNNNQQLTDPAGILQLAGCNIYGRMYRVGRIISELSGPCLECKCTNIGVHCSPLNC